jgi:hypothetical protein
MDNRKSFSFEQKFDFIPNSDSYVWNQPSYLTSLDFRFFISEDSIFLQNVFRI